MHFKQHKFLYSSGNVKKLTLWVNDNYYCNGGGE